MAKKAKLVTIGFFIVGCYGETQQTINETLKFINKIDLDYVQFTTATPFPGTEMARQVESNGRLLAQNWNDYNLFTGASFEWNDLSKEEIDKFHHEMYVKCYMNIRYITKKMFNVRTISDLRFLFDGFKIFKNVLAAKTPNR